MVSVLKERRETYVDHLEEEQVGDAGWGLGKVSGN